MLFASFKNRLQVGIEVNTSQKCANPGRCLGSAKEPCSQFELNEIKTTTLTNVNIHSSSSLVCILVMNHKDFHLIFKHFQKKKCISFKNL